MKTYWGFDSFRPLQENIINSILQGDDTLAIMPTGGGKSLCYQVPALSMEGLCLVISPLVALMKDQVENLRKRGITAFSINSGMPKKEVANTLRLASESNCKFLYVSPERLQTLLFKEWLPSLNINLLAVDEAHCISQWGYDFRPPYLRIAGIREELPGVPVLALTASATEEVQKDICQNLDFKKEIIFRQSFERPNLSYSAIKTEARINKILEILRNVPGSAIVYCRTRRRTKEITELLRLQNISADYYHAGLPQEERSAKQESWIRNQTRAIVCTNAFGMGIDKPDVRVVIHADLPDCIENYYQEAGRAGRDGNKSFAVLLFDEKGLKELAELVTLRYPGLGEIRHIYQCIANYLQLASGAGEGSYFDFDLDDFTRKFKLRIPLVAQVLKTLEQEGWIAFNEQVFLPSTVQFSANKERLFEFEKSNPALEPLLKCLLRSYEGIYDYPVNISENFIARQLRQEPDTLKEQLKILHRHGIIEYSPQKDKPQIFFMTSRTTAKDLLINQADYKKRKEKFIIRLNSMIDYVREGFACRSSLIANYFGDKTALECGKCDNCIRRKKSGLTYQEFDKISNRINSALENRALSSIELLHQLPGIRKEKALKVIEFMQAENKLVQDRNGSIRLK